MVPDFICFQGITVKNTSFIVMIRFKDNSDKLLAFRKTNVPEFASLRLSGVFVDDFALSKLFEPFF